MSKPVWAQWAAQANRLRNRALTLDEMSVRRRCPALDSVGSQCTADGNTEHEHRWNEEDLP